MTGDYRLYDKNIRERLETVHEHGLYLTKEWSNILWMLH